VIANWLLDHRSQAFLPRRNILEGVVVLHETLHELCRKKHNVIILKFDFEKAYDKGELRFFTTGVKDERFFSKCCQWIEKIVTRGSVSVKVNDEIGRFFQIRKGLK
jgi:hypothetical protein